MLKEAVDIPGDDSLKISQTLETIFLQNKSFQRAFQREIPIPPAPEVEPKEVNSKYNTCVRSSVELSKKPSKAVKKARDLLKEAFDITNDDSLKLSRNLELIFLQKNQPEIPIPSAPEEPKEVSFLCLFFRKLFLLF